MTPFRPVCHRVAYGPSWFRSFPIHPSGPRSGTNRRSPSDSGHPRPHHDPQLLPSCLCPHPGPQPRCRTYSRCTRPTDYSTTTGGRLCSTWCKGPNSLLSFSLSSSIVGLLPSPFRSSLLFLSLPYVRDLTGEGIEIGSREVGTGNRGGWFSNPFFVFPTVSFFSVFVSLSLLLLFPSCPPPKMDETSPAPTGCRSTAWTRGQFQSNNGT